MAKSAQNFQLSTSDVTHDANEIITAQYNSAQPIDGSVVRRYRSFNVIPKRFAKKIGKRWAFSEEAPDWAAFGRSLTHRWGVTEEQLGAFFNDVIDKVYKQDTDVALQQLQARSDASDFEAFKKQFFPETDESPTG